MGGGSRTVVKEGDNSKGVLVVLKASRCTRLDN